MNSTSSLHTHDWAWLGVVPSPLCLRQRNIERGAGPSRWRGTEGLKKDVPPPAYLPDAMTLPSRLPTSSLCRFLACNPHIYHTTPFCHTPYYHASLSRKEGPHYYASTHARLRRSTIWLCHVAGGTDIIALPARHYFMPPCVYITFYFAGIDPLLK